MRSALAISLSAIDLHTVARSCSPPTHTARPRDVRGPSRALNHHTKISRTRSRLPSLPTLAATPTTNNQSTCLTKRLPLSWWTMGPVCARPVSPVTTPRAPSSPRSVSNQPISPFEKKCHATPTHTHFPFLAVSLVDNGLSSHWRLARNDGARSLSASWQTHERCNVQTLSHSRSIHPWLNHAPLWQPHFFLLWQFRTHTTT